ncbi:hypothetical protein PRIPAC_93820 [Pristionchus pacificus]|uniref:Uncharacterized protein n=1 Tax=Pristionchus pacificus TaxID=54126 RepID=A0A2A6BPH9_PRIPA|nr:hypothetical protein PRIPAC_93820 [Pristionchus pacificus]|eukprot:PDM67819.1 hypothetical protein PRIPAC_45863 [Pristionchus pacificus]
MHLTSLLFVFLLLSSSISLEVPRQSDFKISEKSLSPKYSHTSYMRYKKRKMRREVDQSDRLPCRWKICSNHL